MAEVEVLCPNCQARYRVAPDRLGRKVGCAKCQAPFTLTDAGSSDRHPPNRDKAPTAVVNLAAKDTKSIHSGSAANQTGNGDPPVSPQLIAGRFQVQEEVGEGSFGMVYKARDTKLDRIVALKVPKLGVLGTQNDVDRFLREARAAGNLRHQHIVPIYDAAQIGKSCFIVSAFIEGQTLEELLSERKLDQREAAILIQKLARALDFAHCKQIVHRDVKPGNVMIDADGEPAIMDFGIARRQDTTVLQSELGTHVGTPAYMSPEQHSGQSHAVDGRADQWALGVMLYELLSRERPFQGGNTLQLAHAVRDKEPERPRKLDPSISKDLETICLKCLEKEPVNRYSSCAELADELDRYQRGEPIQARRITSAERFGRWCRRNPALALTGTVALTAILLGSVISFAFGVAASANAKRANAALGQAQHEKERAEEALANLERLTEIERGTRVRILSRIGRGPAPMAF